MMPSLETHRFVACSALIRRGTPAVAVAALILVGACGGNTTPAVVEDPVPTTLTISPAAVAFSFLGEARALSAIVRDQNNAPIGACLLYTSPSPRDS